MSGKDQESELLKNDGECITCQTFLRLGIAEGYTELAYKMNTFRLCKYLALTGFFSLDLCGYSYL